MGTRVVSRSVQTSTAAPFARTSFTWLAYALLGYYAYLQAGLGPVMPFLRQDLHLSYTVGSLHVSAFALGMMLAGLCGDRLASRWGTRQVLWGGALGMALGALGLALAPSLAVSIASALVMGTLGTLVMVMVQATLARQHGDQRAVALTEANVVASASAFCVPLLVGVFARTPLGWRGSFWVGVVALAVIVLASQRVAVPSATAPAVGRRGAMGAPRGDNSASRRAFRVCCALAVLVVAAEWSMVVWSADYLRTAGGLDRASATTAVSAFFLAEILGRTLGSRLATSITAIRLYALSLCVALAGFPLFWLAPHVWLRIVGLFVTGLGIANLFPLTVSLATGLVRGQADRASARITLAAGAAIFAAPLMQGWTADHVGLARAYVAVPLLLALACVGLYTVRTRGTAAA